MSKISTDEWVAQVEQRQNWRRDPWAWLQQQVATAHPLALIGAAAALAALFPLAISSNYALHVAGTAFLIAILALGLNVVAGYTRMLDLGYVAVCGVGAYTYAFVASNHLGVHLPVWLSLPLVVAVTTCCGLLLGLPSLRLGGDHLAIVTLGFAQVFVLLTLNLDRVVLPGSAERLNLTGGPDGIVGLDPIVVFGWRLAGERAFYYLLLGTLALTLALITHLNRSRLGRAWRALGEDELAAAALGIPVRRLKLRALMLGGAIAGIGGWFMATRQSAVFPANFDLGLLLTLYAALILGGMGSLSGAVLGALIVTIVPELLRDPNLARALFYGGILVALLLRMRPRWHAAALVSGLLAAGALIKLAVLWRWPELAGAPTATSGLAAFAQRWLVIPPEPLVAGNVAFVAAIGLGLGTAIVRRPAWRRALLLPTLYLAAFAWETRLAAEPGITRLLCFGAILVAFTVLRPQGLLGRPHVEVG